MKQVLRDAKMIFSQINRRHMQIILLILSLSLFVLGAGAPGAGSGIGGW